MHRNILFACLVISVLAEYRTMNGTKNNLVNDEWGSINQIHIRRSPFLYMDGISQPRSEADGYPSARLISNRLFGLRPPNPDNVLGLSDYHTYWGQFLDHDITLTAGGALSFPIEIPLGDREFDPFSEGNLTLGFSRADGHPSTGLSSQNPRNQFNLITSYIDASMVYGSTEDRAAVLREETSKGKLKTDARNNFLPRNTFGLDNANAARRVTDDYLFVAGDVRCNENPMLASLHTIFMREHNRLADELIQAHPSWTGEQVYQEARRWIGAFIQSITFNEYVPATIGSPLPLYTGYNSSMNPGIMAEFAAMAFRYGHSEVNMLIPRVDEERKTIPQGHILFRDGFFNPKSWEGEGVEPMLRGVATQTQKEVDLFYVDDIRNFLFGNPRAGGADLAAFSIQRGRDHGLPTFNQLRVSFGLPARQNFQDVTSNQQIATILSDVYGGDIEKLDGFVGGLAEDHPAGSHVGELFQAILREQYIRFRDGDRFFYKNTAVSGFTDEEVTAIDNTKLSHIILRNTNITRMPCSVFYVSDSLDCGTVPPPPTQNSFNATFLDGDYVLSWNFPESDQISITITAKTTGWVGIGFPKEAGVMIGSDAVIGWVNPDGSVVVKDYQLEGKQVGCPGVCEDSDPSVGGADDVISYTGSEDGGYTTITFVRRLSTSDSDDGEISRSGSTPIIFAFGSEDQLGYHASNKGGASVNFFGGDSELTKDTINRIRTAHGSLMFIGWMILFPLGGFIARFFKNHRWWFRLHVLCQSTALLVVTISVMLAINSVSATGNHHFSSNHTRLGLATLIMMCMEPFLGAIADMMWNPKRVKVPFFPDQVHWYVGYICVLLSWVTIYFGLDEIQAAIVYYVLISIVVVAVIVLFIGFTAKKGQQQHRFDSAGDLTSLTELEEKKTKNDNSDGTPKKEHKKKKVKKVEDSD